MLRASGLGGGRRGTPAPAAIPTRPADQYSVKRDGSVLAVANPEQMTCADLPGAALDEGDRGSRGGATMSDPTTRRRVDVHHHVVPPRFVATTPMPVKVPDTDSQ